jgi:hypothetical protein
VYADSVWYFIEPLSWHGEQADASLHIIYRAKDVRSPLGGDVGSSIGSGAGSELEGRAGREDGQEPGTLSVEGLGDTAAGVRGVDLSELASRDFAGATEASSEIATASAGESQLLTANIIPCGDVEFYNISPGDWFARMTAVINDVEGIFADAIGVQFNIVVGIIWTSPSAGYPLTSTSPSVLLSQLRSYCLDNYTQSRHFVHLLTGKNLDGENLQNGYSYPSGCGWCFGYSLAQQVPEGVYGATVFEKAIVSAQAIGRAFNARADYGIDNAWCWCGGNPGFICRTIMWEASISQWICRVTEFSDENKTRMEAVDDLLLDDSTPPACQITINGGDAYTTSPEVTWDGSCTDLGSGLDVHRLGGGGASWEAWECGSPSSGTWSLPGGDGTKTIYLQCRDKGGNQSECSDTIVLDRTAPACFFAIANGLQYTTSANVVLNLSCSDATSGLSRMRFKNSGGAWTAWEPYSGTKSWILAGGDGTKTVYLEVEDGAGNTSQCTDIYLDASSPTCSIVINSGDDFALATSVSLALSASDVGSGISQMRFKDEGGSWTSWQAYSESKSWTLPGGDGQKTVYAEFKDKAGNTSQCTDTITLDTTPPVCSISINDGDDYTATPSVILNLSAADVGSGVSEMRFIDEAVPWTGWEPYSTAKSWTLPAIEGSRTVFVEFRDAVGHTSHCSDKIFLDLTPPTCSMQIAGGAAYSTTHDVTLDLSAADAGSGVYEMRFIDEAVPWTGWEPYSTTKPWTLPAGEGPKTVFVEFRDEAGNTSNCSDGITVDTIAPTCSIAINGGDMYTAAAEVTL